jgi:hypothetical protein
MNPVDLDRLRDIPDPFAEAARAPRPAAGPPRVTEHASPTRAGLRTARGGALVFAFVYEALWLSLFPHHGEVGAASRAGLGIAMAIPAVACAVALAGAVRSGGLGLGAPVRRLAVLALASLTVFVVGTMLNSPADVVVAGYWSHTARCMGITCALAAVPLALGVWAFRRAFVVSSRWRGACLGAAAGALAASTMSLICAVDGMAHVVVGHGLVILVGAAAGAAFGEKIMRA